MTPLFKEWFSRIQDDTEVFNEITDIYKHHYPFIAEGYSDLLEDSDWVS
ncbi:hypothetical protein [Prochlorococcus sp. MIT 1223]|nr:hypothetical protein [Prochlorococcus sp. MIT 1223]